MKILIKFLIFIIIIIMISSYSFAYSEIEANPGTVYLIRDFDIKGRQDHPAQVGHGQRMPNFSRVMINTSPYGSIKAQAYASIGIPLISPTKEVANAYLGSRVLFKKGQIPSIAEVKITFDWSYNGIIGALGVAAGRVVIKGKFLEGGGDSVTILDTVAGGIPSGQISGSFNKSFITNIYVDNYQYTPILEVTVACGTSTAKVAGVCDNDFFTDNREVKLNWIKIEIIRSFGEGIVPGSGCVTSSSCLYPKPK